MALERCIVYVASSTKYSVGRGRAPVFDIAAVNVSGAAIQTTTFVKSLDGVIDTLDNHSSFDRRQIGSVCKACYFTVTIRASLLSICDACARLTSGCTCQDSGMQYSAFLHIAVSTECY